MTTTKHSQLVEKAVKSIDEVFSDSSVPTADTINAMRSLRKHINEILALYGVE